MNISIIHFIILIFVSINEINASIGNENHVFLDCLRICSKKKCHFTTKFEKNQPTYLKLFGWTCIDDCKYECMWPTVDYFIKVENYVPQFFGKWPFIRMFGIQEPLSTLASIGNLLAHAYMINKMRKHSTKRTTPFKYIWYSFGLVSVNAWLWSTIFHAKETFFTEKMDYYCGFSLVMFQFYAFFIRLFKLKKNILIQLALYMITIYCAYFFYSHIYYLNFIKFDYGYNMKVNIAIGGLNSICWLAWSFYQYYFLNKKYVWRCAISIILVDVFMLLEVLDFAPIWWTIDAHALWHLCTICIPFYWYEFIIDDNYRVQLESYTILKSK